MKMKELAGTGMVEVYNNQHLWNNRQVQKVYDAFVDVWGTEKLWVTIDRANKVRIAQYISMMPAEEDNQAMRDWRVNSWKNSIAPEGYAFPGDPRNWEQTKYKQAKLSPLGEKLLGLKKW